jgi:hypothetical protein
MRIDNHRQRGSLFFGVFTVMLIFPQTGRPQDPKPEGVPGIPSTRPNPRPQAAQPIKIDRPVDGVKTADLMNKEARRQLFIKYLRDLRRISSDLEKEHTSGSLDTARLAKSSKEIGKKARMIQSSWSYSRKSPPGSEIRDSINKPVDYDLAIRALAKLVREFLDNPALADKSRVDVAQIAKAEIDLGTIISISKMIEEKAAGYHPVP